MIIGFLGKGGSGKSSVATQMALWLHSQEKNVLAIDADHNMDLGFNLSKDSPTIVTMRYLGDSLKEIQAHIGISPQQKYTAAFLKDPNTRFRFSEDGIDPFTAKYSTEIKKGLRLMSSGPQTDQVMYGQSCSHILTTPLKIYLPYLELSDKDAVVIDEKAGADGVTTGIVTGIDVAVIVCEPSIHSLKTARQIADLLDFYKTPYIFVANKVEHDEQMDFIVSELGQKPAAALCLDTNIQREPWKKIDTWHDHLATVYKHGRSLSRNDRLQRTVEKFTRNAKFMNTHSPAHP